MSNRKNPTIAVYWSQLRQPTLRDEQSYKRDCPFCENGLLLVGRDRETFMLMEFDGCILCGQTVRYLDIEEMRKREGS